MPFPLIVSFHTPDAVYSGCADILKRSLDKFGLEYEIDCLTPGDKASFPAVCCLKAPFIQEKLQKHPGRPIVWLDADSEVVSYPSLLEDIKEDVASVLWNDVSLLISILYCANVPNVHRVMNLWIDENRRNCLSRNADQTNLDTVLKKSPQVSFLQLPRTYAHVPDETPGNDPPVIVQYLASRTQSGFDVYGPGRP
jgi:hypothetical protein